MMSVFELKVKARNVAGNSVTRTLISGAPTIDTTEDTNLATLLAAYQEISTDTLSVSNGVIDVTIGKEDVMQIDVSSIWSTVQAGEDTWGSDDVLYIKYDNDVNDTTQTLRVSSTATPPNRTKIIRWVNAVHTFTNESFTAQSAYIRSTSDTTVSVSEDN